jgi:hypothetical protein
MIEKEVMYKDKYKIFDINDNYVGTRTLTHVDGAKYKKIKLFEQDLLEKDQYAVLYQQWSEFNGAWITLNIK